MDASKLTEQLVKEAKASPLKAGALGLLCVVAVWFWGPLVWKWFRPEEEEIVADVAPTADSPPATGAAPPVSPTVAAALDWRSVQKLRAADSRTQALRWMEGTRDPFERKEIGEVATTKEIESTEFGPPVPATRRPVPPEEAGLVLHGTLVGRKRSLATINDKTYEAGMTILVGSEKPAGDEAASTTVGASEELEYLLIAIEPTSVVLESRGTQFTLPLKKPAASSSPRMQIERKRAS